MALSHSISKINAFLRLKQKFKMAAKSGGKTIFEESCQKTISLCFRDKLFFFFAFHTEIQDGHQKWRENNFCKMSPIDSTDTLRIKKFVQIALSRSVSKINVFSCLMQKFKMATKSGGKTIFAKCRR